MHDEVCLKDWNPFVVPLEIFKFYLEFKCYLNSKASKGMLFPCIAAFLSNVFVCCIRFVWSNESDKNGLLYTSKLTFVI